MTGLLDNTLVGEPHVARSQAAMPAARVLVLGVGNLLMGDEGVGVHVLRLLEKTDRAGWQCACSMAAPAASTC